MFQKIPPIQLGKSSHFKDKHISGFDVDLIKIEPEKTVAPWKKSNFNWGKPEEEAITRTLGLKAQQGVQAMGGSVV